MEVAVRLIKSLVNRGLAMAAAATGKGQEGLKGPPPLRQRALVREECRGIPFARETTVRLT